MNAIETNSLPHIAIVSDRDRDILRDLIALMIETDVVELVVERVPAKVMIKRSQTDAGQDGDRMRASTPHVPAAAFYAAHQPHTPLIGPAAPPIVQQPQPDQADRGTGAAALDQPPQEHVITASIVGTFYAAPSPKNPPYVREGDRVEAGACVGVIEAMKIKNEIECGVAGHVARILAQNGQPVEYGQPLIVIAPNIH